MSVLRQQGIDLLKALIEFLPHPIAVAIFSFFVCFIFLIGRCFLEKRSLQVSDLAYILTNKRLRTGLLSLSALTIALYLFWIVIYLSSVDFVDHGEVSITAISWLLAKGEPIYHALDSPERYSLLYGPALFMLNGLFLKLLGPSIFAAKLGPALCGILSLALIYFIFRRYSRPLTALVGIACVALFFIASKYHGLTTTFFVRPDPPIMLSVALGLYGVTSRRKPVAVLLGAIALGLAINLKINAVVFFLPVFTLLLFTHGWWPTALSLVGAGILAYLPFLWQNVSLENYLLWLREGVEHGIDWSAVAKNLEVTFYLALPALVLSGYLIALSPKTWRQLLWHTPANRYYLLAMATSLSAFTFAGAKHGSGTSAMTAYIPLFAYLCILLWARIVQVLQAQSPLGLRPGRRNFLLPPVMTALGLSIVTTAVVLGIQNQAALAVRLATYPGSHAAAELEQIVATNPGKTIGMSYGEDFGSYVLSSYRSVLTFAGNPPLIESTPLMDMEASNIAIPPATLKALASCQINLWLVPKGREPFSLHSFFPPKGEVFDEAFRATFMQNYQRRDRKRYYDIWACKH